MISYSPAAGPHSHSGQSTSQLMYLVMLALCPATLCGFYLFGLPAAQVWMLTMLSAVVFEALCLLLQRKQALHALDGSALLTGWLLAMSLPPSTPWWACVAGGGFAIVIGKQVFGGLGHNPFNPAMLARVMLLICFPVELTDWSATATPQWQDGAWQYADSWLGIDAISAATPLEHLSHYEGELINLLLGQQAGSLGETSALLIFLGGVFLIYKRVITWTLPMALLIGIAVPAALAHLVNPETFASPLHHLLSGGAFLAAFFIATDMVTSPASRKGQWVFGLGCGLLIWLIRSFGSYPEGIAFAVLIMNATTPVIDHYLRPAVFGTRSKLGA